jgi:hypothetical protein
MTARLTFLGIALFWLTMNGLLWRSEFGTHGGDTEVPLLLVWKKILTAPDASSLTVYQHGERTGYCELSTGLGREMATVDADKPPSDELVRAAGYQLHLAGNLSLGDFTNRLKFDGHIQFAKLREWQELRLKISTREGMVILHSLATNQTLSLKVASQGMLLEREIPLADLRQPDVLARTLLGNFADALLGLVELPDLADLSAAAAPEWTARRTRARIGGETMPVYRLQTEFLGRAVTVDVSTLGEVLRVELPGQVVARIDEWKRP